MQALSVALHLVWLSVALGGAMGAVFLAPALQAHGPGVFYGYLAGLALFTLPAYQAEETTLQLAGRPWIVAAAEGMRLRHMRPVWLWVAGLAMLLLLVLSCLMLSAASIVFSTMFNELLAGAQAEPAESSLGQLGLLLCVLWWAAAATLPAWKMSRVLGLLLPLSLGLVSAAGLLMLGFKPWPWVSLPVSVYGLALGVQFALLSSMLGLGVYYAIRLQPYFPNHLPRWRGLSWPMWLVLGQGLWTMGLVGWSLNWWELLPTEPGLAWLVHTWGPWAGSLAPLGLLTIGLVLILSARIVLLPWRQWLYARFGSSGGWPMLVIAGLGFLFCLRLLLEQLLGKSTGSQWSSNLTQHLHNWAIPLLAVLILSAMIRSVPPAALVWVQRGSWVVAGLRYAYWRYVLRSVLLIWILVGSGWLAKMSAFWQLN